MKKLVLTTLALATLAASSAYAAPARHRAPAVINNATAVYFAGRYIGQDPDAFIRQSLFQDGGLADN